MVPPRGVRVLADELLLEVFRAPFCREELLNVLVFDLFFFMFYILFQAFYDALKRHSPLLKR